MGDTKLIPEFKIEIKEGNTITVSTGTTEATTFTIGLPGPDSENAFEVVMPFLKGGHDVVSVLPSGKTRRLRMLKPEDCDCNFTPEENIIVTIGENENDQIIGVWCSAASDVMRNNWKVLPKK